MDGLPVDGLPAVGRPADGLPADGLPVDGRVDGLLVDGLLVDGLLVGRPPAEGRDEGRLIEGDRPADGRERLYRRGFVCHLHSEYVEETEYQDGGFEFNHDGSSQHCWGAIAMYLKGGGSSVPWENAIEDDEGLEERWWDRADQKALNTVFETEEEFLEANT